MSNFNLVSPFQPQGDQPQAIESLVSNLKKGTKEQILLGVTGSGKTFTMANVIQQFDRPTLVMSHNKTLAAQLYSELREFFPDNAVEYFVSYYDYYQPEAFIPTTNTYIEKDASVNEDLDKLRLKATGSLLTRKDVIIVASVSAIYGLGSPEEWEGHFVCAKVGEEIDRDDFLRGLVNNQYERSSGELKRGGFQVKGDTVELFPSYGDDLLRVEFFGDEVERITQIDRTSGEEKQPLKETLIFPAKHFVVGEEKIESALVSIKAEMIEQVKALHAQGKTLEAERLESRTNYDLDMLREVGYCTGIENYSRHMSGRPPGSRPDSLIDYFRGEFLILADESHVTIPQIRGMYNGDRSRKQTLVDHGFRLPSALDNRPLRFEEFEASVPQIIYVSATPGPYERARTKVISEQLIRPTGLVDPPIEVRPAGNQIDDLIAEVKKVVSQGDRVLVTTLTKRMSEDLAEYLNGVGIRVRYLHSEMDAIERVEVLKLLRENNFDCLVGINLLREGLDLPEVGLVAILDADKEGFLRSEVSLIQTAGRAARNVRGRVIFYADKITDSMQRTMFETDRRRKKQQAFNKENGIVPKSIEKAIQRGIEEGRSARKLSAQVIGIESDEEEEVVSHVAYLERKMVEASNILDFEKAAKLRDDVKALRSKYASYFKQTG